MTVPRLLTLLLALTALAAPAGAGAQATRTWTSGVGDDVNPCSRTAPCHTYAGTINKTAAGGIINVLDPASLGAVTITNKSLTLDGTGQMALLVSTTPGITVNGAGRDVRLRHLTLNYWNNDACSAPGAVNGIRVLDARSVTIDDVVVRGFPGAGVSVEPVATGTRVVIRDSRLQGNCTAGVQARRAGGGVSVDLFDSVVAGNLVGVLAGTDSTVRLAGTTVTHNTTGLATESGASLVSFGDNRVAGNGTDGTPTSFLHQPPGPPSVAGTTPAPASGGGGGQTPAAVPPPSTALCLVPDLTPRTFRGTVDALFAGGCRLGRVSYHLRKHGKRLRTYAQDIRAGVIAEAGTSVGISFNAKPPARRPVAHAAVATTSTAWVHAQGDDLNPCSRTAPCRTFAGAQDVLFPGGEIAVMSPGDFGPLTVDRPLTIDGVDRQAVVLGSGIVVDAGAGQVTLRNLLVQSTAPCSAAGSADGIRFVSAGALRLENVTVRGFSGSGAALNASRALVDGGSFTDNCTAGISAANTDATVVGAHIAGNATGVLAGSGATLRLGANRIAGNATAYSISGTGVLRSWGDVLADNGATGASPGFLPFS
ncbi:MAG: right-handed parallel beta-helix repeat-containing protein [Solirubrobacteraceae bacterium]